MNIIGSAGDMKNSSPSSFSFSSEAKIEINSNKLSSSSSSSSWPGNIRRIGVLFLLGVTVSCLAIYKSAIPFHFSSAFASSSLPIANQSISPDNFDLNLQKVLKAASTVDRTVILTTLNKAWAEAESIIDIFLESFKIGNNTNKLIKHLVIISLDEKAYDRCLAIHPHCYKLNTQGLNFTKEAYFMTPDYLQMMWRRIHFLADVLQLGYNFVFTDADVMWLQDPFPQFYSDVDFQIACDYYLGNPNDIRNQPNGGFNYVKSNPRTIEFYKFWFASRNKYPGLHDQDVLNKIKFDPFINKIGLKMKFLDTVYFGGFCEPSKDFNLVCTMHANCCYGLENKVHDLRIVLQDWRKFMLTPPNLRPLSSFSWRAPKSCSLSSIHHSKLPQSINGQGKNS